MYSYEERIIPHVSVIVPCYNVEKYVDRCLQSITVQSFGLDNLEIICIDDASTDGTWQKLQDWEKRYPEHMMVIHCDVNGKQGTCRNIGLQYTSAPFVSFVDADDWLEQDYFEQLYRYYVNPSSTILQKMQNIT